MKIDINDYSDIEDFWGILGFWGFFYGFSGGIYVLILWYLKGGVGLYYGARYSSLVHIVRGKVRGVLGNHQNLRHG